MSNPDEFIKNFDLSKILHFRLYDSNIQHTLSKNLSTLYYEGTTSDFEEFKQEFIRKTKYQPSIQNLRFKERDSDIVVTFTVVGI